MNRDEYETQVDDVEEVERGIGDTIADVGDGFFGILNALEGILNILAAF